MTTFHETRCEGYLRPSGRSFRGQRCAQPGKFEENGHHYCGTHAPSRIAARNNARQAAEQAAWQAKKQRTDSLAEALEVNIHTLLGLLPEADLKNYDIHARYVDHQLQPDLVISHRAIKAIITALEGKK